MRNCNFYPDDSLKEQVPFPDFTALEAYLDGLGLFRMVAGLERVRAMLDRLGLRRPPYDVAQIAGTNGKGSTSTMLAALGSEHGLRVGLHTSPHFLSIRERIRLDGETLSGERWRQLANTLMRHGGEELSYFEFVTCLAILAFAEAGADLAVMETGLGGSYDATTALEADLVVFTPIGLDHQLILGPSLRDIAADKAGAIRSGVTALTAVQQPEAMEELARVSRERGAFLREISSAGDEPHMSRFSLRLEGDHQQGNAGLALAAWRHIRDADGLSSAARRKIASSVRNSSRKELEARALGRAWLPGRMQRVEPRPADGHGDTADAAYTPCALGWPPLLLDGAHNSHGLAALGRSLARSGIAPAAIIFTCLLDKDPRQMLPHLRVLATGPVFIPPIADNPRSTSPEELTDLVGVNAVPASSFKEALEAASAHMASRLPEAFTGQRPQNPLLICGSLYLLGEFYAMRPDCLSPGGG